MAQQNYVASMGYHSHKNNKACGNCQRWQGERKWNSDHSCLAYVSNIPAKCCKNGWEYEKSGNDCPCSDWILVCGFKDEDYERKKEAQEKITKARESYEASNSYLSNPTRPLEEIEFVLNLFTTLLSYIVYGVCRGLKISLPATRKEIHLDVANRLGSVARLRDSLTAQEYMANMKEIELLKNLAEQIPENYDPSYLIAQKILFGIVMFFIVALVAASI